MSDYQSSILFPPYSYVPFYCEENIWHLCKKASVSQEELGRCSVVFISNNFKMVPLWKQRTVTRKDYVIWDYHVILLYGKSGSKRLVYDFDSKLQFPCEAVQYWVETCKPELTLAAKYQRYYRVINGVGYLKYFSSDRRHMLRANGSYVHPPPSWPLIYNSDVGHSFPYFVSVDGGLLKNISKVYDEDTFGKFITEITPENH